MAQMLKDGGAWLRRHQATIRHKLSCLAVIILISLCFETFIGNYAFFQTAGYDTINLESKLEDQLPEGEEGGFWLTSVDHTVEFNDLNTEIHNLRIAFDESQPAQVVDVSIHFTDDAHHTYFDSTEYSTGVPVEPVATNSSRSQIIKLKTTGYANSLRIEVGGEDVVYPLSLKTIELNVHVPFSFSWLRFGICFVILGVLYCFRPRSSIYRCFLRERPRFSQTVIALVVVFELFLLSSFTLYGSSLVGVASSSYNSGSWDHHSLINTFEVGGDNAQQYAELARSLANGKLYLEEAPPDWLVAMDDPYDKGARDELQKQSGEDYLFDVAYYDGRYYVYFGVVPVLVFYLPFYLLTGANFPTAIGVLFAAAAFLIGITMLLYRFAGHHFRRVSLGLFLLLQIPLIFCCGVIYLLKFPTFYSLPIMLGLAFSIWGLYFWVRGRGSARPELCYLAGSLCMALVFGCRPQLMALSLIAIPLFWRHFITERALLTPIGLRRFLCLIGPYVVVIGALMGYNYARFGSLTDFGANYNLTMNDMTQRGFDLGRIAPALFTFFLQSPATTAVFPYIQPVEFATTYMGQTIREVTFGGILVCLPLLWVLAFSRRILALRVAARRTHTIAGIIVVMLVSGLIVAVLDAEMAGILQRYYADFSFMFIAAAILLVFIVNENLVQGSDLWRLLLKVLLVLVAVSLIYSLLIGLVPETGWVSDVYPWAYEDLVTSLRFWS